MRRVPATMSTRVRVFLIADVRLYRDGIVRAFSAHPDIEVVGAASSVSPDCEQEIERVAPSVLLIEGSAISQNPVVARIGSVVAGCRVVAFGVVDDEREVISCVAHGVSGFVSREAGLDQLVDIIQSVARGEFSCSAQETALLLRGVRTLVADRRAGPISCLTHREQEIIALVDTGLSNKGIAHRLGIELSTVKNHIHNIQSKLHTTRRSQAAASFRRLPTAEQSQTTVGKV